MRCACIDIGSNTTRLLVAETDDSDPPRLHEVVSQRVFNRLRGYTGGVVPEEKVLELAATVAAQARLARESGAEHVCAVATAAIRGAVNGDELCAAVWEASGVEVRVLSGQDEARLAFLGATRMLRDRPPGRVAVVDVGGGSSELVCGEDEVEWSVSLSVGSASLTEALVVNDPPCSGELVRIRTAIAARTTGLEPPPVVAAYAVGGSATSLRRLVGPVLDEEALVHAVEAVTSGSAAEVAEKLDLHPERARLLPAGLLLLERATRVFRRPLEVVSGGIREGVVIEYCCANFPDVLERNDQIRG